MGQINHTALAWRNPQIASLRCSNGRFPHGNAIEAAYLGWKALHCTPSREMQPPSAVTGADAAALNFFLREG